MLEGRDEVRGDDVTEHAPNRKHRGELATDLKRNTADEALVDFVLLPRGMRLEDSLPEPVSAFASLGMISDAHRGPRVVAIDPVARRAPSELDLLIEAP